MPSDYEGRDTAGNVYGRYLDAMGENNRVGNSARGMALRIVLVFLSCTLVGSLAPETGNILSVLLKLSYAEGHFFNPFFFALGIIGIGVALYPGFRQGS